MSSKSKATPWPSHGCGDTEQQQQGRAWQPHLFPSPASQSRGAGAPSNGGDRDGGSCCGKLSCVIRSAIELRTSDYDSEKFQERLAKLSGGVAVLKIARASDIAVGEKKDRVTDALNATKAVAEVGIVPGDSVTLLYASKELEILPTSNFDQKIGVQIIQNALKMPVHTIASNPGVEGSVVVGKLLEQDDPDLGYDAAKGPKRGY